MADLFLLSVFIFIVVANLRIYMDIIFVQIAWDFFHSVVISVSWIYNQNHSKK